MIALTWRQFVAVPTPPPTRGMMFSCVRQVQQIGRGSGIWFISGQ
jgi:hypothetical protein